MSILFSINRLFRGSQMANRRRFHRYDVKAPVTIRLGAQRSESNIVNVSASGAMLVPSLPFPVGVVVSVFHPNSGMTYDAEVLRSDEQDTRLRFRSPGDGTVLSLWTRGLEADPDAGHG